MNESSKHGVIAAGHDITAQAGAEILRAGGNAYDAALAALAAACVAEPVLASMAGGGFMLARPAIGDPVVYDFFVQTPLTKKPEAEIEFYPITADFGATQQEFHIGKASAAVPGQVAGMFEIHKDLGTMPLSEIFAPAIQAARQGVKTNEFQSFLFEVVKAIYLTGDDLKQTFGSRQAPEKPVQPGEIVKQPDLASFFKTLAAEGPDSFYRGTLAEKIHADMTDGGLLSIYDLAAYNVIKRTPLSLTFKDVEILTNPPPSTGGVLVALGLQLLEQTDFKQMLPGDADHLLAVAQAMDATCEARVRLEALAPDERATKIFDEDFLALYRDHANAAKAPRGTTHISVIDKDGNMAAVTVSNGEGCHYVIPGTGVIMNNMMGETDLNPDGFHNWTPGTRMASMMAPTTLRWPNGREAALGSGGSNRIRSAVLQVIVNLVALGMDVKEAVNLPRLHMEPDMLYVEGGFAHDLEPLLSAYPHNTVFDSRSMFFGGVHVAQKEAGGFTGAGDDRRAGVCLKCR